MHYSGSRNDNTHNTQKMIFIVDDSDTNLSVAENALEEKYRVITLPSALKMMSMLEKIKPDLILLDIVMPEMNGFIAIQMLKSTEKYANIPVIFLTGKTNALDEAQGFELGAVDFISKPISVPVLRNRVRQQLEIADIINGQLKTIRRLQSGIVSVLSDVIENRDFVTGEHSDRTSDYMKILLQAMLDRNIYADELKKWDIETAIMASRLHDIGKIRIPDQILNKPGKLTDEEFTTIKTHSKEGVNLIEHMAKKSGDADVLDFAVTFAEAHHEKWNGNGYPKGLAGNDIPLLGRVMAIADVYDALVSERPYKDPVSCEEAERIIMSDKGEHFDPVIADVFFDVRHLFREVTERRNNL